MIRKKLIKALAVLLAAFSFGSIAVFPLTVHAEVVERIPGDRGEWRKDEHGWYYMLNSNAGTDYVRNSWLKDGGRWYYFDQWGYMYRNAWIPYKGDYYYVDISGAMWYSTTTPDGYKVDGMGKWIR